MIPIRKFLYLDVDTVDNHLAVIDGGISTEPISLRETSESSRRGQAGINISPIELGGEVGGKGTTEVQRTVIYPEPFRFQRLYKHLELESPPTYIEIANDELWDSLQRYTVVEVVGRLRLLQWERVLEVAEQFSPLIDIAALFGQQVDQVSRDRLQGIRLLGAANKGKGTTVVVEVLESAKYKLVATLDDRMLRVPKAELEGEVTLFGSVQRKLRPGEKLTLPSLVPSMPPQNRAAKRAAKRKKGVEQDPLLEEIAAPACVVTLVALYR